MRLRWYSGQYESLWSHSRAGNLYVIATCTFHTSRFIKMWRLIFMYKSSLVLLGRFLVWRQCPTKLSRRMGWVWGRVFSPADWGSGERPKLPSGVRDSRPETHFSIFRRLQKTPFCIYMQTVFHVHLRDKAEVWGNCRLPQGSSGFTLGAVW